jgi:hypothetical protein
MSVSRLRSLIHCTIAVYGSRRDSVKKIQLFQCKNAATIEGKSWTSEGDVVKSYERTQLQIHYDGAKDSEAVLEIVGEGPATATPAEEK